MSSSSTRAAAAVTAAPLAAAPPPASSSATTAAAAAVLERPADAARPRVPQADAARTAGQPAPRSAANGADFDMLVLGAGPGGYVAAIRGAQLGLKVGLVEKSHLGGTCLNVGCIPTKAMLCSVEALATARKGKEYGFTAADVQPDYSAMLQRRDRIVTTLRGGVAGLMKKNGIEVLQGTGRFLSPHELEVSGEAGTRRVSAGAGVIIATGSVVSRPPIEGSDLEGVVNSDTLLEYPRIPASMVVIGGGVVAVEWGDIFRELGTKITMMEMMDRILPPADAEVSEELARAMQRKGVQILTSVQVQRIEKAADGLRVCYAGADGAEKGVEAEVVLIATGRWPNTEGLGLERIGVPLERRAILVDAQMRTKVPGVFAIGDVNPAPMLAHVASRGGEVAAETIAGHAAKMDYRTIPSCVYTSPEVAWVGLTEAQARERHGEVRVGKYAFRGLGRAMTAGYRDGFVKVVTEPKYGEILGVHMIGAHVTDLIAEPTLGMAMEATVEELFTTVHAHPTLPEALMEAALDAVGRAIHK